MTVMVAIASALVTLLCGVLLLVIGLAYWEFRRNMRQLIEATQAIQKHSKGIDQLPELCRGLIKICESLAENTVGFSKSVDRFHGDLFGQNKSAYTPYRDRDAERAYEMQANGYGPGLRGTSVQEDIFQVGE